jgi:hypothetical protein
VPIAEQHTQDAEQKPQPFERGRSMPHPHLRAQADGLLAPYRGSPRPCWSAIATRSSRPPSTRCLPLKARG